MATVVLPVTDAMWETALAIRAWYEMPGNSVGGALHVVTDDNNIEDQFIRAAVEGLDEWYGSGGPNREPWARPLAVGVYQERMTEITDSLMSMTLIERWAVTTKLSNIYRPQLERPDTVECRIDDAELDGWDVDDELFSGDFMPVEANDDGPEMEESDTAPFAHTQTFGRFPAGTDPRDALRETMGVFMERTDGTNAMPWWLRSPWRWWHAGPSGWKRGDLILPPSVTGRMPLLDSDRTSVYVTSERSEALMYAAHLTLAENARWPSLYEVSFDVEPQADDTQPESETSFRVPKATIRRVESPSRRELGQVVQAMLEFNEQQMAARVIEMAEDITLDAADE